MTDQVTVIEDPSDKRKYKWRPGSRISEKNLPAEVAGKVLEDLRATRGDLLKASDLVELCRPEDHPLHSHFEWNDSEAARLHRERQARELITSIVILVPGRKDRDLKPYYAKCYVAARLPDVGKGQEQARGYLTTARVMSDEDLRRQVIEEAHQYLLAAQRRYQHLHELSDIWPVIERAFATSA